MSLPSFILIAVALPFVVVGAIWLFAKLMALSGSHSRVLGTIYLALGAFYLPYAAWLLWSRDTYLGTVAFGIAGALSIYLGLQELRRGQVIHFE